MSTGRALNAATASAPLPASIAIESSGQVSASRRFSCSRSSGSSSAISAVGIERLGEFRPGTEPR